MNETSGTFEEIIFKTIYNNKLSPNDKILERLLSSGEFIFLLDGFDEIYSTQKERITFEIDNFIDKYNKNNFLITSRPGSGIESMPRFDNYFVQPLNDEEIIQFIDLQLVDDENQKLAQKIKQVIKKKENLDYKNFLGSPLLLSMFILTFNSYPELPKKKSKFYWNVFDTLATKHDSFTKKGGFLHERKTKLQNEDFEEILKWLAYLSFFEGHYSFDSKYLTEKLNQIKSSFKFSFNTNELIEDLTLAISIIVIDGVEYRFPHKSLQEYFCAMLIKDLAPENKEKIYKEKFWDQLRQTFGGYENFWNLCYEVDKKHFVKNVLIYSLEYFLNRIRYKDLSKKMKKIYQLTGFSDRASYKDGNLIISGNSRSVTPFLWVTEYLNIYAYDIFSLKNATDSSKRNRIVVPR
ncbi:MAG: hypothetical protein IPF54_14305 [Draconibacterium sp.]|nr:hypothetical protein [Draconibacterium sp.]